MLLVALQEDRTFPAAWTSYEFLLSSASPHGTFGSLAYSQIDVLPLIQIASITGALGITFLLLLVPSALAFGWHFRGYRRRAVPVLGVPWICWSGCSASVGSAWHSLLVPHRSVWGWP